MHERAYTLRAFALAAHDLDEQITSAVAALEYERLSAGVAAVTVVDNRTIWLLIEYWRASAGDTTNGDRKQSPARPVDAAPDQRGAGWAKARRANNGGPAQCLVTKGIGVAVVKNGEVDVPLPFGQAEAHELTLRSIEQHFTALGAEMDQRTLAAVQRRVHPHPPIDWP